MMSNAIETQTVLLCGVEPLPGPLHAEVVEGKWHEVSRGVDDVAALQRVQHGRDKGLVAPLHLHFREQLAVEVSHLGRREAKRMYKVNEVKSKQTSEHHLQILWPSGECTHWPSPKTAPVRSQNLHQCLL